MMDQQTVCVTDVSQSCVKATPVMICTSDRVSFHAQTTDRSTGEGTSRMADTM